MPVTADTFDDEDDDRSFVQWLFDVGVIPSFTVALIAVCVCVALGATYGCLRFAELIYPYFK